MRRNPNIKPCRVDVINNYDDHACVLLAMRGRSNKAIYAKTGLSNGQISYRLKKFEIRRMDYRDGVSAFANQVDKMTETLAEASLLKYLKTHIGKG